MRRTITELQERFVEEYMIDLNATAACIRAGYKPQWADSIACRLVKKSQVARAIAVAKAKRSRRTGISADRVVQELAKIAFFDLRNVMDWSTSGVRLRDSGLIDPDDAAAIAEVSETTTKDGGSIKIKAHNKTDALKLLGQHVGAFEEKITITANLKDASRDALERIRAARNRVGADRRN